MRHLFTSKHIFLTVVLNVCCLLGGMSYEDIEKSGILKKLRKEQIKRYGKELGPLDREELSRTEFYKEMKNNEPIPLKVVPNDIFVARERMAILLLFDVEATKEALNCCKPILIGHALDFELVEFILNNFPDYIYDLLGDVFRYVYDIQMGGFLLLKGFKPYKEVLDEINLQYVSFECINLYTKRGFVSNEFLKNLSKKFCDMVNPGSMEVELAVEFFCNEEDFLKKLTWFLGLGLQARDQKIIKNFQDAKSRFLDFTQTAPSEEHRKKLINASECIEEYIKIFNYPLLLVFCLYKYNYKNFLDSMKKLPLFGDFNVNFIYL